MYHNVVCMYLVRSGHLEFQTLYATNDMETPSFTVNRLGAPNDSTLLVGHCRQASTLALFYYTRGLGIVMTPQQYRFSLCFLT